MERAAGRIAELRAAFDELPYARNMQLYREHLARHLAAAVSKLLPDPTRPFTVADLVDVGMLPGHAERFPSTAERLRRHGLLEAVEPGTWRLTGKPAPAEPAAWAPETQPFAVETALSQHVCCRLDRILRGEVRTLDLFLDDVASRFLEQYYDTGVTCRFHNRVVQALTEELVRSWPTGRPLRVLEVGAGTGALTASLLPLLPADRTRYCFTDVSSFFLPRARSRFADYDFVEYRTLDFDAGMAEQGFHAGGFDLVVAANALHVAKDLKGSLRRLSTLPAPGGYLLGSEAHDLELLTIFATMDSFHARTDLDVRPDGPLLTRDQWPGILHECGFSSTVMTGAETEPLRSDFSVFLTRAEGTAAPGPAATAAPPDTAESTEPPTTDAHAGTVHLLVPLASADDAMARAACRLLARRGARARLVPPADDTPWQALLGTAGGDRVAVVVICDQSPSDDPATVTADATRAIGRLRAIAAAHPGPGTELWLVTRAAPFDAGHPAGAHLADVAAWGAARVLVTEQPDPTHRRVCLHRSGDAGHDAERLVRELLTPTEEDEILLTAEGRFVPREEQHTPTVTSRTPGPVELRVVDPGLAYRLAWQEAPAHRPGPGQVVLAVKAAGLNFRDVMQATGLLPPDNLHGVPREEVLGLESAGVVTACGPGVTHIKPGDRVAGLTMGALATEIVCDARQLLPLPDTMSYTEAATLPVAFCTVHYALHHLARLKPGETVLVHGAAGGVGIAALRYLRAHGARAIATAGSDIKRDCLRGLGVEHVFDSRSLDFSHQVMEVTGGEGVDIVLNSLAGEAIARGLDVLRPGGRFIELGKRDICEDGTLPLRPFAKNISFHALDLTTVLPDPRLAGPLLDDVTRLMSGAGFGALPHAVFPAARVADAFRLLQHSRHFGKVVVAFDPLDEPLTAHALPRTPALDADGTYLVTGGTGGFGGATASWLAELGARHLVLVSRRGADHPEAPALRTALATRGVEARFRAADCADPDAMAAVIAEIDASGHPLRGVVHSAMHLDDDPLADLDDERIAAVLAPKLGGALVLDRLTRGRDLDLFLLYSSATASVGMYRQSSYVAANLAMEALARARRARGETALALAWGGISETGYSARSGLLTSLADLGVSSATPAELLGLAGRLLAAPGGTEPVAVAGRLDWNATLLLPLLHTPRLGKLVPERTRDEDGGREELLRRLAGMTAEEARAFLVEQLTEVLAAELELDTADLDPYQRLDRYGLDSLMATQLLVTLNLRYGVEIPPMELLRSNGTVADLADIIHLRLGLQGGGEHGAPMAGEATAGVPRQASGSAEAETSSGEPEAVGAVRG
ncbi:SDR family NAD(P)-dependent oxidoreductase [Streptomyces sp. CA-181903]|uniref:SDR family NAD(P)-dependent oxidoreductase n=1 Tax=Streptomyces sp. CA-181903 TaxID=3240055 RepID=UPI003D902655